MRVVLGVAVASGAATAMAAASHLTRSGAARRTLAEEVGPGALDELMAKADRVHDLADVGAPITSGSYPVEGMIVAPCSMRSLAAIAHGLDDNLLTRAAGVQLKERRKLVLVAREAPLTLAHLRNMTAVTEMGAFVAPPVPAFYLHPASLADVVDQIAARAVDFLHLAPPGARAWSLHNLQETGV